MNLHADMKEAEPPEEELERHIAALKAALGPKYQNMWYLTRGNTRQVFVSWFGPDLAHVEQRVVKIDAQPSTPQSKLNLERGYNTRREIGKLLDLDHPNIIKFYDFETAQIDGQSTTASVEQYFASQTLEERVKREKLSPKEKHRIIRGIADGLNYLMSEKHLLHRDFKPSNILVDSENQVKITDFANATTYEDLHRGSLANPTRGGHLVTDPLTMSSFNKEVNQASILSEIYSFGIVALYTLTGKYFLNYSPESATAERSDTHESLLRDQKLDCQKHEQAVLSAIKEIPKSSSKYRHIIRRCLTLNQQNTITTKGRYNNIDEWYEDIVEASKPTIRDRLRSARKKIAAVSAISLAALTLNGIDNARQEEIQYLKKSPIYVNSPNAQLEVDNNIRLELNVHNPHMRGNTWEKIPGLQKNGKQLRGWMPKIITAKPKEIVELALSVREVPAGEPIQRQKIPDFTGRIYVEGSKYDGNTFRIHPRPDDGYIHTYKIDEKFRISRETPGSYVIAAELFLDKEYPSKYIFPEFEIAYRDIPYGKMVARSRVLLHVGGDPAYDIYSAEVIDRTTAKISIMNPYRPHTPLPGLTRWEACRTNGTCTQSNNSQSTEKGVVLQLPLPECRPGSAENIYIIGRDGEKTTYFSAASFFCIEPKPDIKIGILHRLAPHKCHLRKRTQAPEWQTSAPLPEWINERQNRDPRYHLE